MESYFPLGGLQMPFQRRLSRLYNDTKKSSDFVKEPVQNAGDPEIKSLHRKLRIQKDRLVSWGLEWSDPNQSAEIDESISQAGLSEVVGSIMSTIKDTLAEAEPLWLSSRRLAGDAETSPERSSGDKKVPIIVWDKGRFEDLVRDLTTSIDTLYDLSRTRSSAAMSSQARRGLYKPATSEDLRAFESTRMQTPQQIDARALTLLRGSQVLPVTEASQPRSREIAIMGRQAYSELTHSAGGKPYYPLLLEFAEFDAMYSATGIMPSMTRFEKLSAGLQTTPQRLPGSWTGLPRLLGYFEDMENSRLGLVYQFPLSFSPVSFEGSRQDSSSGLFSLADLLARPDFEPKLEAKFRLAYNLVNTVFDMHARGITHGNLIDTNVSFCNAAGRNSSLSSRDVDIRRPMISSFDLFPDSFQDVPSAAFSLYRHPLDPRTTTAVSNNFDSKIFDLYSLAMLLLAVGLWTDLNNLVPSAAANSVPESVLGQLAVRCGSLYMKAVQACWNAADQQLAGQSSDWIINQVQAKVSRYLEACCILDSVENLEERAGEDSGDEGRVSSKMQAPVRSPAAGSSSKVEMGLDTTRAADISLVVTKDPPAEKPASPYEPKKELPATPSAVPEKQAHSESESKSASIKSRLYPHIALSSETIEQWNRMLMPQINQALRHFYRKHPESVEISLESIGESPKEIRPTVLVVCTSVNKVRAILRRKLGVLFDGTTGFTLKVCQGQVLRSRNRGPARSMAKDGGEGAEVAAANGGFQERPTNGASIGAWLGSRHLPPVSFGGLILVDDRPFGMTVHHMLEDPDAEPEEPTSRGGRQGAKRSGAGSQSQEALPDLYTWYEQHYAAQDSSEAGSSTEDFACEFSDSESDGYSESAITSSDAESDDEGHYERMEPGDSPGVEPGDGVGYLVTQPALNDVAEDFYPSEETQDEDHLDTFGLGEVYASSGIRRRVDDGGLVHEIDWALFEFREDRQPDDNDIPRASRQRKQHPGPDANAAKAIHPRSVVPTLSLPGLEVQCMARTSGLQAGIVLPTLTSVKIYGRASPSHSYQVSGAAVGLPSRGRPLPCPMGIPGDSGAWIIDRQDGQVCGHVLAWSERKRVAYICPMEVLLMDIAETLRASEIRLPGGEVIVGFADAEEAEGRSLARGYSRDSLASSSRAGLSEMDDAELGIEHGRRVADEGYCDEDSLRNPFEKEPEEGEARQLVRMDNAKLSALANDMSGLHVGRQDIGVKGC